MARNHAATGKWGAVVLGVGCVLVPAPGPASAQTRERERSVTVTGPRGRSIDRHFQSTVGPGGIDRGATISRPGATYSREATVSRGFAPMPPPAPMMARGWAGPGRPPVVLERNVYMAPRGGVSAAEAFGIGALGGVVGTGAGLLLGRALMPPPPPPVPLVVTPAPVIVGSAPIVAAAPPPVVVAAPPVVYQPAPVVVSPPSEVDQAIGRLASWHENSRKQACYVLGRLGDPRAVPALVDVLKTDRSAAVRVAAATAIGEIGDPSSIVYLERVVTYDKKDDVRDAATASLSRLHQIAATRAQAQLASRRPASTPAEAVSVPLGPAEPVPPPPTPIAPSPGVRRD